ncbi:MAG: hypothetical protein KGV59_04440 [Tenacibaculum sp.]|nr:hypothetical protein [Tenacibaculum sp.]
MKIKILEINTVNELNDYWTKEDYYKLLEEFNYSDATNIKDSELKEMLFMAITDFEPEEAAEIVLSYKLGEQLNEGQIQSLSHEMQRDRIAEEYPEPALHYDLFNINQLLYKAFNGVFPNTEATKLKFEVVDDEGIEINEDKEIITKILGGALTDRSIIKRLFAKQLDGSEKFEDAHKFIWKIKTIEKNKFEILTSKYWIEQEDIVSTDYDVKIVEFED